MGASSETKCGHRGARPPAGRTSRRQVGSSFAISTLLSAPEGDQRPKVRRDPLGRLLRRRFTRRLARSRLIAATGARKPHTRLCAACAESELPGTDVPLPDRSTPSDAEVGTCGGPSQYSLGRPV